jgi:DNA replication and repair protein RecF
MVLDRLTLTDFRNHRATTFDGTAKFNLLVGDNGAGKTNVLEALSLLAPGRGLRRAQLAEIAGRGGPGNFAVSALLALANGGLALGTGTRPERPGRRTVVVNGAEASAAGLAEWLSIGWLTPAMDRIFSEGGAARRRFLDRLTLALEPGHAAVAARYEAALRERNRLLAAERDPEAAWLDAIETQMAAAGGPLAAARARTCEALGGVLAQQPEAPFARPALAYLPGGPLSEDDLRDALAAGRRRDLGARRSLIGPHRDDIAVIMLAKNRPAADCSTGEQKAMLIAILLAHSALLDPARPRLLLLDEVAAHLDPLRRAALFERLRDGGAQVWMTGTETAPFQAIAAESATWTVRDGAAVRAG